MEGCGRRFLLRLPIVLAAATIAFATSSVSSMAAGSPLTMALQVGYHNSVKLGQWMPVTVDITNNGPDFDGMLEVQASNSAGGPPIGAAVYEAPVSLAAGATKHFRTYVAQDFAGPITARITQNGRELASKESSAANTFSGLMVGVLSDQPSTLDSLGSLRPGGSAPLVVHLTPGDVADSAPVLRAFDVIAIDDFATDTLTSDQKTALTDYVEQGGGLLLGAGGSWRKTLGGLPQAIVPMQVSGSMVLASAAVFGRVEGVEVATGTLSSGAIAWLAEGSLPLLVEAQAGKGMVMLATFDWAQDAVVSAASMTPVLRQALVRMTYGNLANPSTLGPATAKGGSGGAVSLATKGGALSQALGNLPALQLPAWWLIGGLVLVYVLLVGPVNYFVLRAIGRRALAWITVPAIALVASAGAYGTGIVTKGTSVVANEVSVIHVQAGSNRAYEEAYTGIMTPTRGDYEVGIGATRTLISPIYYYTGNSGSALRVNTVNSNVTLPGMTAFTLGGFANEGTIANAPDVTGEARMVGGQLTGRIVNSSAIRFSDGVVISGDSFQKIGALGPGGTTSFSLTPSSTSYVGPPLSMTIYPNNFGFAGAPPNNPSDVEREMETRSAVLSTLLPVAYGGYLTASQPTIVLWSQQQFQSVTVNGAHPHTYIESAVVLTLPIQQVAAGALPSGVVQGRMIDIEADTSQGPPGMVIAQSGSVTYDFDPNLAAGGHLSSASITNTNPFGPKGFIGSTGTAAAVKAQVWDWRRSAWTDLSYQETGTTAIPDSAVNPTTGEVRLKLSSEGQFATGWLSLTGTVS